MRKLKQNPNFFIRKCLKLRIYNRKFGFLLSLDFSTMPTPTESIPLSISFLKSLFYRYIPAFSAKSDFRPISTDFFSSGRLSNTPLYPFSIKEVPYAIKYSFISSHSCHNPSNNALLSIKVSSSSKPCGGL